MAYELANTADTACVYVGALQKEIERESEKRAANKYQGGGAEKIFKAYLFYGSSPPEKIFLYYRISFKSILIKNQRSFRK